MRLTPFSPRALASDFERLTTDFVDQNADPDVVSEREDDTTSLSDDWNDTSKKEYIAEEMADSFLECYQSLIFLCFDSNRLKFSPPGRLAAPDVRTLRGLLVRLCH